MMPVPCLAVVSGTIAFLLTTAAAAAQTTSSQPTSMPTTLYSDPAFGFELALPAGWEYDRTRFQTFKDSIGLLRGRGPGGRQALQVLVFRSFPMPPFEDWIIDFGKASAELVNSARVDWETWQLPPRAGAILSYRSRLGAVPLRSHYLCVPFDQNTVWVLVYSASAVDEADEALVRREFDTIAASLRVHYDPQEQERLAPAFERGRALLAEIRAQGAKVRLDEAEHVYEVVIAGRPVGYMSRRISREEYDFSTPGGKHRSFKPGLRLRERFWRFAADGTVRRVRFDAFTSFDRENERVEQQQTQIPAPDATGETPFMRTEQVVRDGDALFVGTSTNRDTALPEPGQPIAVGPVYLDQAWVRLLPGLLLGRNDELHAVAAYNFEARALVSITIKPLGPRPLEGFEQTAYAFEVREGLIGPASLVLCDERGVLLRHEAGEIVITRTTPEKVEREYGAQRDAARRRFQLPDD